MFKLFKRKTEEEKLQIKYKNLIEESYKFSTINRTKSDRLAYEANEILIQIEILTQKQKNEKK